jgi:2-oxoglutarate/2-oxoacid ferredoxin oxidoreductase subunit beta
MTDFLNTSQLPYCKGCGHDLIARNTVRALEKMNYAPLDVIIVTDIGCHGIIDKCLNTHTVHGLHGRSTALGAGISYGIQHAEKKIIVFIGDGGATIGLNHILEAARLNLDMTVIVHNNYLYGMTGGQTSGLTPEGFKTTTSGEGNLFAAYDVCALTHAAGAAYTSRIMGVGDISDKLAVAIGTKGFSLTEVLEICPSYGMKLNPGRKLAEIVQSAGKPIGEWTHHRESYKPHQNEKTDNLLSKVPKLVKVFNSYLKEPLSVIISGSAGEGVQMAAGILCKASMLSGLSVTQKGSYPVTVGVGFSTTEINLSNNHIRFHGIDIPDIAIITSEDGLNHNYKKLQASSGTIFLDQSLKVPETQAHIHIHDFRSLGARNAAIYAVFYFALKTGIISIESLLKVIDDEGKNNQLPLFKIKEALTK